MNHDYRNAVKSEHANKSPRELLQADVTVLVGVDEEAEAALELIDVSSVNDLATSEVFEVARAVSESASRGEPSGGVDRTTALAAADRHSSGDVAELAASDIGDLEGISESAGADLSDALGVRTVRDLAQWPAYRGALDIFGALTGEDDETEDGVPKELVPTARKYGTEQTYYSQIYIDRRLVSPKPDPGGSDDSSSGWRVTPYRELPVHVFDTYGMNVVAREVTQLEQAREGDDSMAMQVMALESMEATESEGPEPRRTIVLDSEDLPGKTTYNLKVTGTVEAVDDETLPPGIEVTENRADAVMDSEAAGKISSGADGYRFSGKIVDLSLSNPDAAAVHVDGVRWQDGAPLDRTLVIDSTDDAGATDYSVEVGGSLVPVDGEKLPPGISVTWGSNDEASRDAASGEVSTGADGFRFSGDIDEFVLDEPESATVYLDGERVEYPSTLGQVNISMEADEPIDVEDEEREGFSDPAVGGILQFSQRWVPQGLSLGQLLHSTTLAPGESTKVAVIDWSRRTRGERTEAERQRERTEAGMTQNRSISEVQNGVASEIQHGSSTVSTESTTSEAGGGMQGGVNLGIVSFGGSASASTATTNTTTSAVKSSMGRREVHSDMTQKISNATQQHASSSRTRRATVVRETQQEESEEIRTRVITNHNHMHALSVHYYEVVQIFRVEVAPEQAKPVMFVPFEPLDFSNTDLIHKHRQALKAAALDETTRELLDDATGFMTVVPEFELAADSSGYDLDSALANIGADLRAEGVLAVPRRNLLESISVEGPEMDLTIHRRDGAHPIHVRASEAVSQSGSTVYPVEELVTVRDIDRIDADLTGDGADAAELGRTLVVNSRDVEGSTDYEVSVSGSIEFVDDARLHDVDVSENAGDTAGAHTATGRVTTGADGVRFTGDVERIELSNPDGAEVIVDGEPFDDTTELDRELTLSYSSGMFGSIVGTVPFTVEVSGGIIEQGVSPTEADSGGRSYSGQLTPAEDSIAFDFSGRVENVYVGMPQFVTVEVDGNPVANPNRYSEQGRDDESHDVDPIDVGLGLEFARPDESNTGTVSGRTKLSPGARTMRILDVVGSRNLSRVVRRLNEERLYYSQAVWMSMDAPRIAMMLQDYDVNGRSAAEFVEPVPEATHGNLVAFPLALPESVEEADDRRMARLAAWWTNWRERNFEPAEIRRDLVPLPSGGVHGEGVLGRANSAEKLDITRFWDWQESPIPQQAPQVSPIKAGSRATGQDLRPGGFDQPIVQMQQPQALPDPTGVGAVLDTLGKSDMFRDMSGIEAATDLATTAQKVSGQGARHAADTAKDLYATAAKQRVAQTKTLADLIKSLNEQGGKNSAGDAKSSNAGAMINEADKMQGNGASPPSGDGAGGGGTGGGSGGGLMNGGGGDLKTKLVKAYAAGSGAPILGGASGAGSAAGLAGLAAGAAGPSAQPPLDSQAGREYQLAMKGMGEWTWAARRIWTLVERAKTVRYPQEPETNVDGLPIPPWIDDQQWKSEIEAHYNRQHQELVSENPGTSFSREPSNVLGDFSEPVDAEYFVVHNPQGQNAIDNDAIDENYSDGSNIHLWLGVDDIELAHDWHERCNGVKLEEGRATCFLHAEVSFAEADKREENTGLHAFHQYYDLANAYVAASLRAGRFLTVTGHKEVDRAVAERIGGDLSIGHGDPLDFNFELFYTLVNTSLGLADTSTGQDGLGLRGTFGVTDERMEPSNQAMDRNEFVPYVLGEVPKADQYGPVQYLGANPPEAYREVGATDFASQALNFNHPSFGGGNTHVLVGNLPANRQCGGGSWPDRAEAPPVPEAARPYVGDDGSSDGGDGSGTWV